MRYKTILEIGKQYNLLKVIEYSGLINHRPTYRCICTCGREKIVEARSIASQKTKSCGCLRSVIGQAHIGYPYKNYIGKRFDRLLVLAYDYNHIGRGAHLLCRCDCGTEKVIEARKLNHNVVKSCGCKLREHQQRFKDMYRSKNVTQ